MAPSHYELLKIQPTAGEAEIRSAYRRAAKGAHPDKGGTQERFAQIQAAWKVLSDPDARRQYDVELGGGVVTLEETTPERGPGTKPVSLAITRAWARHIAGLRRGGVVLGLASAAAVSGGAIAWGARSPQLAGTVVAAAWMLAAGLAIARGMGTPHRILIRISATGVIALVLLGFAAYGQGRPGWIVWLWAGILALWTAAVDGIWELIRGEEPTP